ALATLCCSLLQERVQCRAPWKREVATMLKAIHAQEDRREALAKAQVVVKKLALMKLKKAADTVHEGVGEAVSYYEFPREHWRNVKTNNPLERILLVRPDRDMSLYGRGAFL